MIKAIKWYFCCLIDITQIYNKTIALTFFLRFCYDYKLILISLMKKILYFFLLFALLSNLTLSGQNTYRTIQWKTMPVSIDYQQTILLPGFDEALHLPENEFLPMYSGRIPLPEDALIIEKLSLTDQSFSILNDPTFSFYGENPAIDNQIDVNFQITFEQKKPFLYFSFIPIRKNEITASIEKLTGFTLQYEWGPGKNVSVTEGRTYADQSVLSEGNWYKIRVSQSGIFRLTKSDLEAMGLNLSGADPRKISIYGNGGGMLSESLIAPYTDDLLENAIYVEGENDGVFNDNDFILFYAKGPHKLLFDKESARVGIDYNIYDDFAYYFITVGNEDGKRISGQNPVAGTAEVNLTSYHGVYHHETDLENLIGSGRKWFGENFDYNTSLTEVIALTNLVTSEPIHIQTEVAAKSGAISNFRFYANNDFILNIDIPAVGEGSYTPQARIEDGSTTFNLNNENLELLIEYDKPLNSSEGWLNYFTLNYLGNLNFQGSQMAFRNFASTDESYDIVKYTLGNAGNDVIIWNVTDPANVKKIIPEYSGNTQSFQLSADTLHQFIAFNSTDFFTPEFVEVVSNQNLHGLGNYDMIVITPAVFNTEAQRLADFHITHDNLSVATVLTTEIYNEFSGGAQDITGIRDFIKMMYDRAPEGEELKYVLLFGDASYDYKDIQSNNTNFVPSWESLESVHPVDSYVTDDYYALLDDVAFDFSLDIGIGRFVVMDEQQAKEAVDKVIHYATNTPVTMSDWRNVVTLLADDEDNNIHFDDVEELAYQIDTTNRAFNINKIMLDAYLQESTPSGDRYPEVEDEIKRDMDRGTLIMNYVGHGGEGGWAHERILTITDINNWNNFNMMPLFITATCEFSRFDDPNRVSGGELVFLNPGGGGIALFSTTRATYAGSNAVLNKKLFKFMIQRFDNEYLRLGDILKNAKNEMGSPQNPNNRKYALLGDPALKLAIPHHQVMTTHINDQAVGEISDTLKALSLITVSGEIHDIFGNKLEDFNGILTPTVFDKPKIYTSLANDGGSYEEDFLLQDNILYKGNASIVNGEWTFSFIVPKDIVYDVGWGKISFYARNDVIDGHGYHECLVGGFNENAMADNQGPEIQIFMNGPCFADGDITGENPVLFAYIYDESGINTASGGIGHDIVAILDKDQTFSINQYYKADLDSYQRGTIEFPLYDLEEGEHEITLKVWDVYNNSSSATIHFIVNNSGEIVINELQNYPNPFSAGAGTRFTFKHNQGDTDLDIQLSIYSMTGQLVYSFEEFYPAGECKFNSDVWYGDNAAGHPLSEGVYIYRATIEKPNGTTTIEQNKLVLVR